MVRIVVSTIVAGVIFFAWGFLAWGILPLHDTAGGQVRDEVALATTLREQLPETGVYYMPYPPEGEEGREIWTERHEAGPLAFIAVTLEGTNPMDPMLFVKGFLVSLATGLVTTLLLFAARGSLRAYVGRVLFVAALGLIPSLVSDAVLWNWMYFPRDWILMNVVDHMIGFGACGVVIAAIIKPAPRVEHE